MPTNATRKVAAQEIERRSWRRMSERRKGSLCTRSLVEEAGGGVRVVHDASRRDADNAFISEPTVPQVTDWTRRRRTRVSPTFLRVKTPSYAIREPELHRGENSRNVGPLFFMPSAPAPLLYESHCHT